MLLKPLLSVSCLPQHVLVGVQQGKLASDAQVQECSSHTSHLSNSNLCSLRDCMDTWTGCRCTFLHGSDGCRICVQYITAQGMHSRASEGRPCCPAGRGTYVWLRREGI
ncbi:hypothetical protein F5883DRAFT_531521 [Diaporthe sp. PMI_573]|nr:hypothetical protein F5883DRAFT_531521 [Diaporthaceae sp. PMI_573]